MTAIQFGLLFMTVLVICDAQRPSFAGFRPIGYPEMETNDVLDNRFGNNEPLPIEANGDRGLVNRLNKMPIDNRPFWFINSKVYDAMRYKPQTWSLRSNGFVD